MRAEGEGGGGRGEGGGVRGGGGGCEQEGGEEEVAVGAAAAPPTPLQSILAVWCYIWYAATLVPCDAALLMPPLLIPPRSDAVRLEARPSNALYCACNRWAASMSLLSHCSADLGLSCTTVVIYVYCIRIAMNRSLPPCHELREGLGGR